MGDGALDADVVVVGAGFAGLALAHVVAAEGMSVIVLERRTEAAIEGAGVTLQANGLSVLERLGLLDEALAGGHRVTVPRPGMPSGRGPGRVPHPQRPPPPPPPPPPPRQAPGPGLPRGPPRRA